MDWWDDEFCERLASGPRFVIRYDLRDTGQSVSYEPGAPQYRGPDLVTDAVGEEELRALAGRIVERTVNIASSMTNHWLLEGGEPVRPRLGGIRAPTLVLHGTPLAGMSHEMPPRPVWDRVVAAILHDTAEP